MATVSIDPARLMPGVWCHKRDRTIGEGDIYASYSADRIGMGRPVARPFTWRGGQWVCVSIEGRKDQFTAQAYRLTHPAAFEGVPVTYGAKTLDAESARGDPDGFYHGITVTHAGASFVLTGPPVTFTPGQAEQLALF